MQLWFYTQRSSHTDELHRIRYFQAVDEARIRQSGGMHTKRVPRHQGDKIRNASKLTSQMTLKWIQIRFKSISAERILSREYNEIETWAHFNSKQIHVKMDLPLARILLQTRFFVCSKIWTVAYSLAQANCRSLVGTVESCCKQSSLFAARFAQSHNLT